MSLCPNLQDFANLNESEIEEKLNDQKIIFLFSKACQKKQNESYNKWREHLFVKLFNMVTIPETSEKTAWRNERIVGEHAEQWVKTFQQLKDLEKDMLIYEEIINDEGLVVPGNEIIETKIHLQAGQGNYDFDFIIKFNTGPQKTYHYEYKNHPPGKLPQLLSLYDAVNPHGEKITSGARTGQFKKRYLCAKQSYFNPEKDEKSFEFWEGNGFWKWHLTDDVNGIPAIRAELATKGIALPVISELDYFCHVKKKLIPGRWGSIPIKADTIEELNTLKTGGNFPNSKKLDDHIKEMKIWHAFGLKNHPEDPYMVVKFFQILFDNKDKVKDIRNCDSMKNYLTAFKSNEGARNSLLDRAYASIRAREGNKRFIFYYPLQNAWRMGSLSESFEKPDDAGEEIFTITTDRATPHLRITTKSGNTIDFDLRWANGKGLQNTAWKMNIHKNNTQKNLEFNIIRGDSKKAKEQGEGGGAGNAKGGYRKSRKTKKRKSRKTRKKRRRKKGGRKKSNKRLTRKTMY